MGISEIRVFTTLQGRPSENSSYPCSALPLPAPHRQLRARGARSRRRNSPGPPARARHRRPATAARPGRTAPLRRAVAMVTPLPAVSHAGRGLCDSGGESRQPAVSAGLRTGRGPCAPGHSAPPGGTGECPPAAGSSGAGGTLRRGRWRPVGLSGAATAAALGPPCGGAAVGPACCAEGPAGARGRQQQQGRRPGRG